MCVCVCLGVEGGGQIHVHVRAVPCLFCVQVLQLHVCRLSGTSSGSMIWPDRLHTIMYMYVASLCVHWVVQMRAVIN